MIQKDEGQRWIHLLLKERRNPIFNDYEKRFITQISTADWDDLSRHQKIVVERLIGWLKGHHDSSSK